MGVLNADTAKEFSRCDKQFVICSQCEWKQSQNHEKIEQLIKNTYIHQNHVTIVMNMSKKESTFPIFSDLKLRCIPFPVLSNPFQLKPDDFRAFHQFLERN